MFELFKRILILIFGISVAFGFSNANNAILSQDGPLGIVSIGQQQLKDNSSEQAIPKESSKNTNDSSIDDKTAMQEMKKEMAEMRRQMQEMRKQQKELESLANNKSQFTTYSSKVNTEIPMNSSVEEPELGGNTTAVDILENVNIEGSIIDNKTNTFGGIFNDKGGVDVGGAPAITTGGKLTFLGSYSGNNSVPIGQIPDNLFASTLLGQREQFDDYSIFFGAFLEADAQTFFGSKGIRDIQGNILSATGQNIYLTTANLYFLSNIGHYVTAQFDFDTDESGNFGLGNAFVIFGNLDASPFFVTVGKSYLSVGAYGGGGPLTNGITQNLFEPGQVTNISINYKDDIWNANIAISGSDDRRANFSTGIFYADNWSKDLAVGLNAGYIYNLAASSDSGDFEQFLDQIDHQTDNIGSFNIDANFTYNMFGGLLNLGSGWATTTNKEDFNGNGNNVLAGGWYVAANYSLTLGDKDTNFGVSYGQTYNAAQIPMQLASSPISFDLSTSGIKEQLIFSAQRAYFDDNVLFGPEYVYQKLYDGNHMNTITLDMSVYI
ncbi:LbtU family siderophore porin [Francisella sciaenopsi]|uniref:Iron acquisition protein FupA n=1 Tax=Francisella sciaenopsi TaxID=3055034 RepID=A0ABQ6PG35_9GAMM